MPSYPLPPWIWDFWWWKNSAILPFYQKRSRSVLHLLRYPPVLKVWTRTYRRSCVLTAGISQVDYLENQPSKVRIMVVSIVLFFIRQGVSQRSGNGLQVFGPLWLFKSTTLTINPWLSVEVWLIVVSIVLFLIRFPRSLRRYCPESALNALYQQIFWQIACCCLFRQVQCRPWITIHPSPILRLFLLRWRINLHL